jgi:hypothetical protein
MRHQPGAVLLSERAIVTHVLLVVSNCDYRQIARNALSPVCPLILAYNRNEVALDWSGFLSNFVIPDSFHLISIMT